MTFPYLTGATLDEKPYNVGILGYGNRGSGLYSILDEMSDKFHVSDICDNLPFRLDQAKNRTSGKDIRFHHDLNSMLDQKDLDAVFVATPLSFHFEHAKAAFESGKHIYLEKTMTFSVEQAQELCKIAAERPNQILQVGHQFRYSPLYFKVKEMIDSGYLGKITAIDARWDRNHDWRRYVHSPEFERQINWRMYREYSGGLAAELLSHQMDFIHWAFDCVPSSIYGIGGIDNFKDGRETFDNIQLAFRYEDVGMVGSFGATCSNKQEGYIFKIKGSKGMLSLLMDDGIFYPEEEVREELAEVDGVSGATKLTWTDNKQGIKLTDRPLKEGTYYAVEDFYRCLQEKRMPYSNAFNGGQTAIAVALANESLHTGSVQPWREDYNLIDHPTAKKSVG
nr:Gfo/Idh/MocA family oxidoreductase [Litoribacter alkaliphilus]